MARTLEPAARAPARSGSSDVDGSAALVAAALAARDVTVSADAAATAQRLVRVALGSPGVARAWVVVRHEGSGGYVEAARGPMGPARPNEPSDRFSIPLDEAARLRTATARAGRRIRPGRSGARLLDAVRARDREGHGDLLVFGPRCGGEAAPLLLLVDDSRRLGVRERLALQLRVDPVGFALVADAYAQRVEAYREEAERDFLTGIYNRRLAMRLLEKEIRRTRRTRAPLSLLLLDVDNFKAFNDTCGHLAGDDVLRVLARIVTQTARTTDIVGRFGGEEFMVVLPDTSVDKAVVLAERLRTEVERFGREHVGQWMSRPPTISIGVCAVSPRDDSEAAIGRCDRALYESKHRGRNCFSLGLPDEEP
jgi:diguanylate cyclase (GGDEF)-like protein